MTYRHVARTVLAMVLLLSAGVASAADGEPAADCVDPHDGYADLDADGYGTGSAVQFCGPLPALYAAVGGDCDDLNPSRHPNASEICADGIDENCDGNADAADPACLPPLAALKCVAAKARAAGKKVFEKMKCQQKAYLKRLPVDPACLEKAETRFTVSIAKADAKGPCLGTA